MSAAITHNGNSGVILTKTVLRGGFDIDDSGGDKILIVT